MKLKTLIHSLIFCHVARALSKANFISVQTLKDLIRPLLLKNKKNKNKTKLFLGRSFRLHYNWCTTNYNNSSYFDHYLPIPSHHNHNHNHLYYDATWNSYMTVECGNHDDEELSGYLHWLERKGYEKSANRDRHNPQDDIDRLADAFIESCHVKFRLEKQDSYRRFQEMMERSV